MPTLDEAINSASPNSLDAAIDQTAASERRRVLYGAVKENPDSYSKAVQLSQTTGVPAPVVARNLPTIEQRTKLDEIDAAIEKNSPLARHLQNPDFAAVSHDDVGNLRDLSNKFNQFRAPAARTLTGTLGDIGVTALKGAVGLPQAFAGLLDIPTRGASGQVLDAIGVRFNDTQKILDTWYSPAQQQANQAVQNADGFTETLSAAVQNPSVLATSIGQSLPQMVGGASVARGLIKLAPSVAPVIAAAIGEGVLGAGSTAEQIRANNPQGDLSLKQSLAATVSGIGTAVFSLIGGKLAQRLEIEDIDTALVKSGVDRATAETLKQGFVRRLAEGAISEGIFEELPQSAQEQLWQNFAADKPLTEGVGNAAALGLLTGGLVGGSFAAARRRSPEDKAQAAERDAQTLAELSAIATASKVRPRDMASFENFLKTASEDGPVTDVYLDVQTLQQTGVDIAALVAVSPTAAAQLPDAVVMGGDLIIPVSEYISRVAGSDLDTVLAPHLRTAEDAFSLAQAQFYQQEQQQQQAAFTDQTASTTDTQAVDSAGVVEAKILDELTAANRFTPSVNRDYAALMKEFYSTTAGKLGITPEEMLARYPIKVAASSVIAEQKMNQGDSNARSRTPPTENLRTTLAGGAPREGWAESTRIQRSNGRPAVVYRTGSLANGQSAAGNPIDGLGFQFSPDRNDATEGVGVQLDLRNPKTIPVSELPGFATAAQAQAFARDLAAQGHDGLIIDAQALGGPVRYVAFDAQSVLPVPPTAPLDMPTFTQGGNQGEIAFAKDITQTPSVITLFNTANLSTFLHEMGHFQLEVLAHIASRPDAPLQLTQEFDAALNWFKPGMTAEDWQGMSLEEKRPYHEQFARGFEAYLFEGRAPNLDLHSLFQRFRDWLTRIYQTIRTLNVPINDEIRGVFDRLLATEDAIQTAQAAREYNPMFATAVEMGDAEMFAEYQRLGAQSTGDGQDELQRRSLRDMRWLTNARSRLLKELQADAKSKRQAVEEEVKAEVQARPVYLALLFLRQGEIVGEDGKTIRVEKGHKLDRKALAEMYPVTMLGRPDLSTGLRGLTDRKGLHPDLVAQMFDGFTSGDHLVHELINAPPQKELIQGLTDQRVLERYGDITNPDTLARAADEAIHNEARGRFVATELKALAKTQTPVRVMTKAAKAFAAEMLSKRKLREIKPAQFTTGEVRAGKAAETARVNNDLATAAAEKRNQLVHHYAVRGAYDALTEIEKGVRWLRKLDSADLVKRIDSEYADQIYALLERFDLRASVSAKEVERRESLLKWVESQQRQGFEPDIPEDLITEALRKPYKELTLSEFRGLLDTIKQIEHLGRLKRKLLKARDAREFQEIRDEIAASIVQHAKGVRDLRTRPTTSAALVKMGRQFLAMHRKMASKARELDGFQDGGPMWEHIIRTMNESGDQETEMRAAATAKIHELIKPVLKSGSMGGKGIYFETLGGSYNREERIALAFNLGNAGNLQRLLDGEGWTLTQLQPLLDTITPEEADFVQGVWDFFESYRPQIAAKEERVYNKQPNWVEPTPVFLGGKTLRGGYYPVKYDTARSAKAEQYDLAAKLDQQKRAAYTSATTRRSFTKDRAKEVKGRPLLYSFAGLYQGTNEVIHDLAWHEWLIDTTRLLRSLDSTIRTHYGDETMGIFNKAVEDIAVGDVPAQNVFERALNHVRTGATVAGMAWNVSTALLQVNGLTQSMVRIGPAWVTKGLVQWLKSPLALVEEIHGKSKLMRSRGQTMQREINEIRNQVRGSKFEPVKATYFLLIQKMQMVADIPTWQGAYEKAIAANEEEDRAIALADQAVLDAQGGGQTKDLAQIQRMGPALKLFTNFYSYFNVTYQLALEKTKEKISDPKQYPSLALDYLLLFTLPATLGALMKAGLSGGSDDEDALIDKLIAENISYMMGTMVGLRETAAIAQRVAGVEQFKSSYGGPAGLRLFQELDKLGTQASQGDLDAALLKAANNVGGIAFHYPSGQINRTVEGVAAIVEGDTQNPAAVFMGAPKP